MVEKSKMLGQYFTPEFVADFMCDLSSKLTSDSVLEPCAGKGIFLSSLLKKGFTNITSYEINSTLKIDVPIKVIFEDFLKQRIRNEFDLVIGNPPYVRWKNIPKEIQTYLTTEPFWTERVNSLTDLLYPFIYASVDALKNNGELIFITPIFWTKTLHSSPLRKFLCSIGELEILINFGEMRIFEDVASTIMIFKYKKTKTGKPIKVINLNSKKKLSKQDLETVNVLLNRLDSGENYIQESYFEAFLHPQFGNGQPWNAIPDKFKQQIDKIESSCIRFSPLITFKVGKITRQIPLSQLLTKDDLENLEIPINKCVNVEFNGKSYYIVDHAKKNLEDFAIEKIYHRYVCLGDIAEIANGLVSGLDKAFRVEDVKIFNEREKEKFVSVIKAYDLNQYYISGYTPYIFVNDIMDENELRNNYPNIYNQLAKYKIDLEKRYSYDTYIPWWHWVFLRNWKLLTSNNKKIFTPCKERIDVRNYARFSYVEGNYLATQDVTAIVKKEFFKEDLKYILAILNSESILVWMKYKGLARGGVLEFSEKPLYRVPIRLINWDNPNEVEIHNSIVNLVNRIIENNKVSPYKDEIEKLLSKLYSLNIELEISPKVQYAVII